MEYIYRSHIVQICSFLNLFGSQYSHLRSSPHEASSTWLKRQRVKCSRVSCLKATSSYWRSWESTWNWEESWGEMARKSARTGNLHSTGRWGKNTVNMKERWTNDRVGISMCACSLTFVHEFLFLQSLWKNCAKWRTCKVIPAEFIEVWRAHRIPRHCAPWSSYSYVSRRCVEEMSSWGAGWTRSARAGSWGSWRQNVPRWWKNHRPPVEMVTKNRIYLQNHWKSVILINGVIVFLD